MAICIAMKCRTPFRPRFEARMQGRSPVTPDREVPNESPDSLPLRYSPHSDPSNGVSLSSFRIGRVQAWNFLGSVWLHNIRSRRSKQNLRLSLWSEPRN
jgi:hypothetical protein